MAPSKWLRGMCAGAMLAAAATACAAPEIGWYWNPAESGRGFFVESDGGITYIAGYLYDEDGHALWLAAGSANADPYNFAGRLLEFSNGQTLYGDYVPPAAPVDRGAVSVHFSDDQHGTITWPGGAVQIEREIYGTGPATFPAFSGWWWNPDESGRGYSVEIQGNNLFIVSFMYDDAGRPVWFYSAGPMDSDTTYTGTLLQFAGGQTLAGPYKAPTPAQVGTLAVEFTAADEAVLTFTDTLTAAGAKAGRSKTITLRPEFRKCTPVVTAFFGKYVGNFTQTTTTHIVRILGSADVTYTVVGNVTWEPDLIVPPTPFGNDACGKPIAYQTYTVTGGLLTISVDLTSTSPAGTCHETTPTPKQLAIPADLDLSPYSSLSVSSYGRYVMSLNIPAPPLDTFVSGSCDIAGHDVPESETLNYIDVTLGRNTGGVKYAVNGGFTTIHDLQTRRVRYSFAGM